MSNRTSSRKDGGSSDKPAALIEDTHPSELVDRLKEWRTDRALEKWTNLYDQQQMIGVMQSLYEDMGYLMSVVQSILNHAPDPSERTSDLSQASSKDSL